MSDLKPCPFCGSSCVEISRYGNSKVSTFYQCNDCGVSLETSETFNHGTQWNNRPHEDKLKAEAVESYHRELLAATKFIFHPHFEGVKAVWLNKLERGDS